MQGEMFLKKAQSMLENCGPKAFEKPRGWDLRSTKYTYFPHSLIPLYSETIIQVK